MWPCPSEYYEDVIRQSIQIDRHALSKSFFQQGRALSQKRSTVRSLYELNSPSLWDLNDNPISLRSKSYALLHRASTLVGQAKRRKFSLGPHIQLVIITGDPSPANAMASKLREEIQVASRAISNFADFLGTFHFLQHEGIDSEGVRSALVIASTAVCAAVVQINEIFASSDPEAPVRQRNACKSAVLAVEEAIDIQTPYLPLALGVRAFLCPTSAISCLSP